jgi:hypothetical protein
MQNASLKDAFDILNAGAARVDTLWHFYALVTLGVLGFVLGNEAIRQNRNARIQITIAFAFFALVNALALFQAQTNYEKIVQAIKKAVPTVSAKPAARSLADTTSQSVLAVPQVEVADVIRALQAYSPEDVVTFQVAMDLLIVLLILSPTWRPLGARLRQKRPGQ